jgi:hypothetical protein
VSYAILRHWQSMHPRARELQTLRALAAECCLRV